MIKNFLKKIYISKQFSKFTNFIGSPWKGKGAILMYHRVLPDKKIDEDLNLGLAVSCSSFEKQIRAIKEKFKICSINEFVDNLRSEKNEFMLAITFDDGYKDNLLYALPILEKFQVPATIYVTTSYIKENVSLWWHELKEKIINEKKINFRFEKKNFKFILNNQKQKNFAYNNLRKIFLNLKTKRQTELLEIITGSKQRKNYSNIFLNENEVKTLDKHNLITIGCHSHNHLNFKILNDEEIQEEANKSLEVLENLLNHKVKHFCYPYGGKNHAFEREYNIIKKLNFTSAVTGRVFPINDYNVFSLPRIYIGKNMCDKTLINHLNGFYNLTYRFL